MWLDGSANVTSNNDSIERTGWASQPAGARLGLVSVPVHPEFSSKHRLCESMLPALATPPCCNRAGASQTDREDEHFLMAPHDPL